MAKNASNDSLLDLDVLRARNGLIKRKCETHWKIENINNEYMIKPMPPQFDNTNLGNGNDSSPP